MSLICNSLLSQGKGLRCPSTIWTTTRSDRPNETPCSSSCEFLLIFPFRITFWTCFPKCPFDSPDSFIRLYSLPSHAWAIYYKLDPLFIIILSIFILKIFWIVLWIKVMLANSCRNYHGEEVSNIKYRMSMWKASSSPALQAHYQDVSTF